jgi:hypothetical protein
VKIEYEKTLKYLIAFIGIYHVLIGIGLMFSVDFQKFAVAIYQASFEWTVRDTYFIRILGSFVFTLGSIALVISYDPLKFWPFILCYAELFILRDLSRHLYSEELYTGFQVPPWINNFTSIVFAAQAFLLSWLVYYAKKQVSAQQLHIRGGREGEKRSLPEYYNRSD